MEVNTINLQENNEELNFQEARSQLLEGIKMAAVLSVSAVAFVTALGLWFANTIEEKPRNDVGEEEVEAIAPTTPNSNLETAPPQTLASPEVEVTEEVVVTGQKIADAQQLERLRQQLLEAIDGSWQIPLRATSAYVVRVDETGAIVGYKPANQAGVENEANTPLPQLLTANNPAAGDNPQADFAEFEVVFSDTGTLEVKAK
jgi:hypothetical protein